MAATATNVDDLLLCPMCLNTFDSPRTLPCHHSFCLNCIKHHCKDKAAASKPFCPLCKQNFEVSCNDVGEFPCNDHLQRLVADGQLRGGENGNVDLKALSRRLRGVHCEKHDNQLTTSRCLDCQENVCTSCGDAHHKKHKLQTIETLAAELKPQIDADVEIVSSRIPDVRDGAERLKTERQQFVEDVDRQETAIRQKGEELKSTVDRMVDELLKQLMTIKTDGLNSALAAENRLLQVADTVQSYCEYSREILTKGGSHDVIRYANAIRAHATDLLENRITLADYAHAMHSTPCVIFVPSDAEHITTQKLLGCISTPLSSSGR